MWFRQPGGRIVLSLRGLGGIEGSKFDGGYLGIWYFGGGREFGDGYFVFRGAYTEGSAVSGESWDRIERGKHLGKVSREQDGSAIRHFHWTTDSILESNRWWPRGEGDGRERVGEGGGEETEMEEEKGEKWQCRISPTARVATDFHFFLLFFLFLPRQW